MKRTPLKKGTKKLKQVSNRKANEPKEDKMWPFLHNLYTSMPLWDRVCQSCGNKLHNEPRTFYFDHLIEKNKRPDLAMEKDNIFICCLTCHALKTDGHPTEVHKAAIEKAKEKFGVS